MSLNEFGRHLCRALVIERSVIGWRCYFPDVVYADKAGPCAVTTTIIGAGPNQQRARQDLAQKLSGKVARIPAYPKGCYAEFPVPVLSA